MASFPADATPELIPHIQAFIPVAFACEQLDATASHWFAAVTSEWGADMNRTLPRYALVGSRTYVFAKSIQPAEPSGLESIVICQAVTAANVPKEERYLPESRWLQAAAEFSLQAHEAGVVTSQSPTRDKIALYRSLFKGRNDVYAHGYLRKDGGIGYAPACENGWRRGVCPRTFGQKARCASCSARAFKELSDAALIAHFKGNDSRLRDVIGLYVLNADSKTYVLVLDFDKDGWQDAIAAVRTAASRHGLEANVERSRSGNGGHVWLFFEEAIDAKLARDFGSALISEAMTLSKSIGFDAFDRMFPSQSTVPEGGFGNLISAPLQGQAQRQGNSVFIDESFVPYPDQWLYLSKVKKLSKQKVRDTLQKLSGQGAGTEKATATPWAPRAATALSPADFPNVLEIVEADMLYVAEQDLSAKAAFRIKRLAAFANPEFYKLQAMHRSVYKAPRVIYLGETRGAYIALPRGCKPALLAMLEEAQAKYKLIDKRREGQPLRIKFKGALRPGQQEAVDSLAKHENGILSAPTGFGKTVVAAALIAKRGLPTLVIVPKTALVSQWADKLEGFLSIGHPGKPALTPSGKPSKRKRRVIGQIGGRKNRVTGIVDIATFQSLTTKDPSTGEPAAKELVRDYGLVVCDECHHAAAPQLELILKATPAKYVHGLSATPKRADGLDRALFMLCGPIRCRVDPKEQARQQGFRRILRTRFTGMRLAGYEPSQSFNQILDGLCKREGRNELIARDIAEALQAGRRALVLTKRKEHARVLGELIGKAAGMEAHVLVGEGTARQRREKLGCALEAIAGGPAVIVATESYLGEGFDASGLDALFLATPISWDGNVTQQVGRLHRVSEGKADVIVTDYVDVPVPMLERMYKKRLKTYARLGYEVEANDEVSNEDDNARFVLRDEAAQALIADIAHAKTAISITAPYASPKAIGPLLEALAGATRRGVEVACALPKDPGGDIKAAFAAARVPLKVDANARAGLAIFDRELVWYGPPLLAFPRKDDCGLRFRSPEAARELTERLDAEVPASTDVP